VDTRLQRMGGDDGAVVIEFALVLPFLLLLVSGVLEFGQAFRSQEAIAVAARAGMRQASNLGKDRMADSIALQSIVAQLSNAQNITVNRIVIYKTTAADGAPTSGTCLTQATGGGVIGACNIYTWANAQAAPTGFTAVCTGNSGTALDHWWCPTDRKSSLTDPPDYLGVYINATYNGVTGILPGRKITLTDKAVARLEPA
jgi:Flp pilus assembly protein TadG